MPRAASLVRRTGHALLSLFDAVYARDLAVREAQAIGLWVVFLLVWIPLIVVGEPIFTFLVAYVSLPRVIAMLVSLAAYVLPVRWIAGRLSAALLDQQRQRIAQGRASALDGFWGPFLVGAPIACVAGALFTYLWIEMWPIALLFSALYFISGLAFKPWRTPIRQAVATGILFGVMLPGFTIGVWMLGH
jgi:hypothetical protein